VIRYETRPARTQAALDAEPFHLYTFEDGTVWTEFYRSGDAYVLRFPELADFEVSADGTEVIAHPTAATDEATIEHLYINQLVPLALSRQGRPAYHASVVTVPGGAVAFLGKTGMGKSTLAASFALNESAFLTDDALLIEESDGGCLAMPSHASLRLWDDGVEALVDERIAKASAISYSDKARLLAGEALTYSDKPQPLLAAYVLERQNARDVTIQALTGLDRYMVPYRRSRWTIRVTMAFCGTCRMLCGTTSPTLEINMQLDAKLSIPPQVMSRLVGDETVLLDLASGIYFGLDGVGKRIWESVGEGLSLGETAALIATEFEVEEAQAQADLVAFASDLVERGLLIE